MPAKRASKVFITVVLAKALKLVSNVLKKAGLPRMVHLPCQIMLSHGNRRLERAQSMLRIVLNQKLAGIIEVKQKRQHRERQRGTKLGTRKAKKIWRRASINAKKLILPERVDVGIHFYLRRHWLLIKDLGITDINLRT